ILSAAGGAFDRSGFVTKMQLNAAIARVFGMLQTVKAINAITTSDGYAFKHASTFGYSTVAHHLRTYFNLPNSLHYEIFPAQRIKRGEFAYALSQLAATGWRLWFLRQQFSSV